MDTRKKENAMRKSSWLFMIGAMAILIMFLQLIRYDYSARQNENRRKLGAVYMTLNNPFYEIIDEEIRTAVENHGDTLITRDPALDVAHQIEEIRELINRGVELIFINPVDWQKIEPALKLAELAHIPVIAIDTSVANDQYVACTIVSDNYLAGVQCAQHLIRHAEGGRIALLKHSQARSSVDRIKGFLDTLEGHSEFVIVDEEECFGQLELAMPAMETMLSRHPDISIVMALNDPAALGAIAALQNAGRLNDVRVYGVDGVPETKEMIFSNRMTATAVQSPRTIGRLAADCAYKILDGREVEPLIQLPTKLLSKETVNAFNIEGWD